MSEQRIHMPSGEPTDAAHHDPSALVENIYRKDYGTTGPLDSTSHFNAEEYLKARHEPEETEHTPGGTVYVAETRAGFKTERRLGLDGWLLSPKAAGWVTLIGLVGFNGYANANNVPSIIEDAGDGVKQVVHTLEEYFNPLPDKIIYEVSPGPSTETQLESVVTNYSEQGEVIVNREAIDELLESIREQTTDPSNTLTEITVIGSASDEVFDDASIGASDTFNSELASSRAQAVEAALREQAAQKSIVLPDTLSVQLQEDILSIEDKAHLQEVTSAAGFATVFDAVAAQAQGDTLSPELTSELQRFIEARQAAIHATITHTEETVNEVPTQTPQERPAPEDPIRPYDWEFVPFLVPPLPRLRVVRNQVMVPQTTITPYQLGGMTTTTMKVYEEGVETSLDEDGIEQYYLKEDAPWQYTRKFQHLLRDDRIQHVLRGDYQDAKGEEQSLRVMFVDHEPTTETVALFQDLLESASQIQDGTLASKHSAIMVYPTSETGPTPAEPKRVGLGIDTQETSAVLGFNMPLLKLVELHMPAQPQGKDITDFMGVAHTLAHELHGHGSDITDRRIALDPVAITGKGLLRFAALNPWKDTGRRELDGYTSLIGRGPFANDVQFVDEAEVVINENDTDTLANAQLNSKVRIDAAGPTRYGSTAAAEGYADSVAILANGTSIPWEQAGVAIDQGGYYLPEGIERIAQINLGAEQEPFALQFAKEPEVIFSQGSLAEDPYLRALSEKANARAVPVPEDMHEVITSVSHD